MTTRQHLVVDYDTNSDVLYLALGAPVPASTDEDDEGLLVRYALADGHPCGVTVLGYRHWKKNIDRLTELVSGHLHIRQQEVARALNFN